MNSLFSFQTQILNIKNICDIYDLITSHEVHVLIMSPITQMLLLSDLKHIDL